MKRTIAVLLCALLVASSSMVIVNDVDGSTAGFERPLFSGTGSGTIEDPYVITTVEQLQEMQLDRYANYTLGNDINASDTVNWNSGRGFLPISSLSGSLDGLNNSISELFINREGDEGDTAHGLVNYLYSTGRISNVILTEVDMRGQLDGGWTGPLVGWNMGLISNCHASGTVRGAFTGGLVGHVRMGGILMDSSASAMVTGVYGRTGGLAGSNILGFINRSIASGNVSAPSEAGGLVGYNYGEISESFATGSVSGTNYIGGLVGHNSEVGKIVDSFATGPVTGSDSVGGLVGWNALFVNSSYSIGSVSGTTNTGGLIGYMDGSGAVLNSYWDTETSGQPVSMGGTGKTTAEMKQEATFTNWDFTDTWSIDEGVSYPYLLAFQEFQEEKPVAYWPLNEGADQWANDTSGNGNDGILGSTSAIEGSDPAWTPFGISGSALKFDGVNDQVDCGNDISLDLQDLSISLWVKPGSTQVDWVNIVDKHDGVYHGFGIEQFDFNTNLYSFTYGTGSTWCGQTIVTQLPANEWHYFTVTKTGNEVTHYLDGVQSANGICTPATIASTPLHMFLGRWANGGRNFNGAIDEVMIWDRALTSEEIFDRYINTLQNYLQNETLNAYWPLDEGVGQLAEDITGNGHNGTLGSTTGADANDPAWTSGILGGALNFDGTDDYIQIPITEDPDEYTLEAWVRPTIGTSRSIIVQTDANGPYMSWSHQLRIDSSGRFVHYLIAGGAKTVTGTTIVVPGRWYHVVGTATEGGTMALYVNGVTEGGSTAIGTMFTGGDRYRFGSGSGDSMGYFQGTMDEVSIWSRALTGQETLDRFKALAPVHNLDTGEYFTAIQAAIEDSDTLAGHTIFASANTYNEKLTISKRLTIQGAGMGNTTINGGGSGNVIIVTVNWVNITGFKITGSGTSGSTPNIDAGVRISAVQYCNISGNNITGNRNGVNIVTGGYHRISGNQIRTSGYDGIFVDASTFNRFDNNTISGFSDSGIWLRNNCSNSRLENNTISTGPYGIYVSGTATAGLLFKDNIVTKTTTYGSYLSAMNTAKIIRNTWISNTGTGLYLVSSGSNTISNNTMKWNNGTYGGIFLEYAASQLNIISYNTVTGNSQDGIRIRQGTSNKVIFNNITGNAKSGGGYVGGIHLLEADYTTVANNSLFDNIRGITVDGWNDYCTIDNNTVNYSTVTGMVFSYSANNLVKYNMFYRNAGTGISLGNSDKNTMSRNVIKYSTGDGIYITVGGHRVLNNTITNNGFSGVNVTGNSASGNTPANLVDGNNVSYNGREGITLWDSTSMSYHTYQNTITNNVARGNSRTGISLVGGTYKNIVRSNNASGNIRHGISLDNAPDSTVINNTLAFNGLYGMYVTGTASSKIYHNNLLQNTNQAYENGDNIWNLGYAGGGNHWSDWTSPDDFSGPAQDIAGADSFVDSPRVIPGGTNKDSFPWTTKNGWYGYVPSTGPVVNTDTGEFFFLIQDAINDPDTLNGHTLTVGAGMYFETITVNKRLTIIGAGASVTTIRGGGSTDVITISANWVNISGLKVMNGGSTAELAGIRLNSVQNCNISACTVTGNLRHGIMLNAGSLNSIYASTVSANAGNGIYIYSTSSNRIIGNTVEGNLGAEGGIYMTSATYNTVSGNIIRNHPQSGVMGYYADYNQISRNTLTNNSKATSGYVYRSAIHLYQYSDYNRINNNTLTDNRIALGTQLSITYNVWDNNTVAYSSSSGMILSYAAYNTVKYSTFHHNAGNGIAMGNSDHNTFSRNNIYSNTGNGIGFSQGGYHKILNNTITNNSAGGINMTGSNVADVRLCHLDGNNVSYNNFNGIDLYDSTSWATHVFFENVTNNVVIGNNGTGIKLVGGTYTNTLRGNTVLGNKQGGIALFSSGGNIISNNNVSLNPNHNIFFYSSSNNRIMNNNVFSGTGFGFNVGTSSNNNIFTDNKVSDNDGLGLYICWNSGGNTVARNVIEKNYDGVYVDKSSNNVLYNNTCANNTRWGLWFGTAGTNNRFYHNNLIGNGASKQAQDDSGVNLWDNGYPGGGNYWSDYTGTDAFSGASQNIAGSDGFGDTAYTFPSKQDNYPLMFQSNWWSEEAPEITLVSPADGSVIQSGTLLDFYIWDADFDLDWVNHNINGGPGTAFGVNYDIGTTGWAEGDYAIEINAMDKLGNPAQGTFNFRVDDTDPTFTVELSLSLDADSDGLIGNGDTLTIWVNVTDANEDATTAPVIDVDETDFPDQTVNGLTYQGSGIWTCTYTVQAGDFNTSDIDVTFADKAGNSATQPDARTFKVKGINTLPFTAGWNLVSFPSDLPTVNGMRINRASDIANQTTAVMISKWNPLTQKYINYIPEFHLPGDPENFAIGPDDAIFVYASGSGNVAVSGYRSTGQRNVTLVPGWNLVGYHNVDNGDVSTDWAPQVSCGLYDDICYWDGTTFVHYIFATDVMQLVPGRGYFVWSDVTTTLTY